MIELNFIGFFFICAFFVGLGFVYGWLNRGIQESSKRLIAACKNLELTLKKSIESNNKLRKEYDEQSDINNAI